MQITATCAVYGGRSENSTDIIKVRKVEVVRAACTPSSRRGMIRRRVDPGQVHACMFPRTTSRAQSSAPLDLDGRAAERELSWSTAMEGRPHAARSTSTSHHPWNSQNRHKAQPAPAAVAPMPLRVRAHSTSKGTSQAPIESSPVWCGGHRATVATRAQRAPPLTRASQLRSPAL